MWITHFIVNSNATILLTYLRLLLLREGALVAHQHTPSNPVLVNHSQLLLVVIHPFHIYCLLFAGANTFTSLLAGFVIFATLGNMSYISNVPIHLIAESGPGLAFIIYPKALGTLPGSPIWSFCFFIMIILLGIDSMVIVLFLLGTITYTYLFTYACYSSVKEHRLPTSTHHPTLFWSILSSSFQLLFIFFISASISRRDIFFGVSLFGFPSGFQVRACLVNLHILETIISKI
ncbi:unnamed protein product [Schistosoma curassoni]|uniref:Uncharacterized protein n=1 Tax=Schistosoma curassoni TaxID=6186 RepID=A0A3P7YMP5_9TREM|nr:unnamed protein product [Schistosoma curassoni]